jgi:ABC-type transport system involved in cytochrome bd biosynthesis fused ATPase/permease subunit
LVNLILGFIKPQTGKITLGDEDLNQLTEEERLTLFSVVDQKPFFFHQSILENLQLGNPKATKEEIMEILKKVGLESYIVSLEKSLDTPLFEWGSNLSTGELQRMAIARALLRKAKFYIFDEPTAVLDSYHEKMILELIFELKKEHGVLLITHGHNMLDQLDSIIRMNNT